ncbi:VOC family protein [Nonomuraea soli]|uniref:Catechol 2,3-dioxygenase-like lactoylglutathione lyase family enzyme n=1 Tax=Nonomuraea soli TaxID=1032476 RepID=A0A7W0HTZ5_9ACTN|nr:VOC family protein [Nonomuraea soli]MBA2895540.1 catechol 2,3-dioxygenase-like lactoylglutathione lyase family enzyme [Nonomuraea soli]
MITAIHHVQLAAPKGSEPRLKEFYEGVLGLKEVPKPPELAKRGGAWFRGPGVEVHLGIEDDFRPAAKAHPGFLVDNLDELAKMLPEAIPDNLFPGYRRIYVKDPVGNRIELLQAV